MAWKLKLPMLMLLIPASAPTTAAVAATCANQNPAKMNSMTSSRRIRTLSPRHVAVEDKAKKNFCGGCGFTLTAYRPRSPADG